MFNQGSSAVLGQTDPPPTGCEGVECLDILEWPAFTIVYKTKGDPIHTGGQWVEPAEVRKLEWRARDDWTMTILYSEPVERSAGTFSRTGSWSEQKGRIYTRYDAVLDRTTTDTVEGYLLVDGFSPLFFSFYDLATRTDGERVSVDADICTGDACHAVLQASRVASDGMMGRRFSDRDIESIVFTDDTWRIPLKHPGADTLQLQIQPTTPNPVSCQTNLREVIVSADLDGQQWDPECASTNRTGANAHYYTFEVGEEQMVTIEAESSAVDLYLYLLSGAGKTGTVIAENDDLSGSGSSGRTRSTGGSSHASGVERRLSAGTYTAEVTTNETGKQSGAFSLNVQAPVPIPTPTPTPTPTPAPTATPVPLDGNPRAESVTGTSVTVSWDRLGRPQSGGARDYRVNYRRSASDSWTLGNYVTSESFGTQRPQTTVPRETAGALQCNTQ